MHTHPNTQSQAVLSHPSESLSATLPDSLHVPPDEGVATHVAPESERVSAASAAPDAEWTYASLLGIPASERDASRIIMAAQLRLRLLRQRSFRSVHAADDNVTNHRSSAWLQARVRQVSQARDELLKRAVLCSYGPGSPR